MSDPVEPTFAQSWEIASDLDPETAEPLPLSTHAPLLYVDDAAPLVLYPVTVVEMRRVLRQVHRAQKRKGLHLVVMWLLRLPLAKRVTDRLHRNRIWRAEHPVAGILVHERTIILAPVLVMTALGFLITATA